MSNGSLIPRATISCKNPVLVGFSVADTDMKKNSRPISAIAGRNEDGLFPLRSLVVAQVRAVELEIQQLLVREIPFSKRLEILRQTPCDPAHHRLRDTRAAQHVRERRLKRVDIPWTYIRAISSSSFSVRLT